MAAADPAPTAKKLKLPKSVSALPRRMMMASGAKVAVVALTGFTGAMGFLGYQFFNSPGPDPAQVNTLLTTNQTPSLIPADFVAGDPARLTAGSESAAAPWAAGKETAPVTPDSPWMRNAPPPADDNRVAAPPEIGRRTFGQDLNSAPTTGNNNFRSPADTRPTWQGNDTASPPVRLPAAATPLSPDPRVATGNSLRSTSPTIPNSGNTLDNRSRTSTLTPNTNTSPLTSQSQPGQRMMRCVDPCNPNIVRCVPVNPCGPVNASPSTSIDRGQPTVAPKRLTQDNRRTDTVRVASLETGPQPTLANGVRIVNASNTISTPSTEVVLPEDSYWTIAERVYGDGEYYRALQEYHLRRGVRRLEIGDELAIPNLTVLRRTFPHMVPSESRGAESRGIPVSNAARTELRRLYFVNDGDTLRSIAARELGDANRADEIAERNRATLEKAGYLRVGLELVLPGR